MEKRRIIRCLLRQTRDGNSFLIMKLTIVLTILLSISAFGEVASQNVSLKCENVLLREVFKSLKQQTGYLFVFNEEELDKAVRVSVDINNSTLAKALDRVLLGLPYTYEIIDDMVVIKPAPVKTTARDSVVRKVEVKGVVKDCKGELLPGVTVLIKGTAIGVATNVNGEYTIALDPKKQSLLFSFIGMRTKEVVWNGQKRLDVVLDDDCVSMDEVVVTGYQTIDKRKLTSSISSLTDKDLGCVDSRPDVGRKGSRVTRDDVEYHPGSRHQDAFAGKQHVHGNTRAVVGNRRDYLRESGAPLRRRD